MAKLRVKNFGPIKDGFSENDGFMEITPVTVICGNQATGKSTIAKLYSTLTWLEKSTVRTTIEKKKLPKINFISYCKAHKLHGYFSDETEIKYIGNTYTIEYKNKTLFVDVNEDFENMVVGYNRPKIMYVPAERNLLTTMEEVDNIKNLPIMLSFFLEEYNKAKKKSKSGIFALPISGIRVKYNKISQTMKVLTDNGTINITDASSGVQSATPLSLVTRYLAEEISENLFANLKKLSVSERELLKIWLDKISGSAKFAEKSMEIFNRILYGESFDEKDIEIIKNVLHFFFNTRFINIVEEPEQNLYPESQGKVLYELLECLNTNEHNQLIITTHSPYMLSYLTQSAKADELLKKGVPAERIEKIVPVKSAVASEKISIYETKEDGSIKLLKPYENLPSDENLLNAALADGNERFSKLLDLEVAFCK